MFLQMGHLKEVKWEKALLSFINKVKDYDIEWWLTGSCALAVRGISTMPHDVDIMLNSKDIDKIKNIFSDFIVEPIISSKGWVVDYFGVLFLNTRIDLAFDPQEFVDNPEPSDFGIYAMNNTEMVQWKGNIIKVPPLELQLQVNKRRKRYDRVKTIEDYLKNSLCQIKMLIYAHKNRQFHERLPIGLKSSCFSSTDRSCLLYLLWTATLAQLNKIVREKDITFGQSIGLSWI